MDWALQAGQGRRPSSTSSRREQVCNVDYDQPITNGPNAVGFDYYFGISASLDMVPYTFIENDRVTVAADGGPRLPDDARRRTAPDAQRARPRRASRPRTCCPTLTRRPCEYIDERSAKAGKPFFLYLPLASPHTPIAADARSGRARAGSNPYADFVMQTDRGHRARCWTRSDKAASRTNTLVIFTSDNGCSPQAEFAELLAKGHNPSHVFRGTQGRHLRRRPPRAVPRPLARHGEARQRQCDAAHLPHRLIATCADDRSARSCPTTRRRTASASCPRSLGETAEPRARRIVHHSINGSFAIREGNWKLVLLPRLRRLERTPPRHATTPARLPPVQLYDLADDIGETKNVQASIRRSSRG